MPAKIIDGTAIAKDIRSEVASSAAELYSIHNVKSGLAAVLVGDDPASTIYVRNKGRACEEVGIYSETFNLKYDTSQKEILSLVDNLNHDPKFSGILVQLPLPEHIQEGEITRAIEPSKDVDGLHPTNLGLLLSGEPRLIPCTPAGVQQILLRSGYDPSGKHVVICGRSNIVGKPLSAILGQKKVGANATVTLCHTGTMDLPTITRQADILIAATGRPNTITADMVKPGVVIVDVGVNRISDSTRQRGYRLVGDVQFDEVLDIAEAITPVPGGVGPMTIAMLLHNTIKAAYLNINQTI